MCELTNKGSRRRRHPGEVEKVQNKKEKTNVVCPVTEESSQPVTATKDILKTWKTLKID